VSVRGNADYRLLPCRGGCGRTVRCHPAVSSVICTPCSKNLGSVLARLREKKRTEGKD
jgi:hypothetical protein